MTSTFLLQTPPMFVSKSSPKSSTSSPVMDCLTPAHSNHALHGQRQSLTDPARFHQGHSGHRNSGIPSQLRCNPHFSLSLSPSSSSSSSLRSESRPGMHGSQFMPHYLQHRNIFGVMGSPWVPNPPELNKHLPQLQMPLENMELWQGGSLINPGASPWVGFESRGRNVPFPYPYAPMNYDVRRKNATRESTTTLKAWLYKHIKNPYPTKGEKVMLAIITKMSLTQVSTWFANARRRLKKENKMQWSPRQRTEDDEDKSSLSDVDKYDVTRVDDVTTDNEEEIEVDAADDDLMLPPGHEEPLPGRGSQQSSVKKVDPFDFPVNQAETPSSSSSSSPPAFPQSKISTDDKPKIWSLASMVDCDSEKKSTNEKKTRVHQLDSSSNERQTNAWVTPTWMFHAAICRQMLNLQLQQQQQQQQQHHRHHHHQLGNERMDDQSSSSELTTQREEFRGTPSSHDVTGEGFQQPITSDD